MSAGIMIPADGMEWPLETFIDAYGFTRTDELDLYVGHPLHGRDDFIQAVTASGDLITDKPARHLPWGDVIAIKGRDGGGLQICDCCGSLDDVLETGNGQWCGDCLDDSDWDGEDDEPDGGAAVAAVRNAEGPAA